jgi:outer membrane protein assembly factor BamA
VWQLHAATQVAVTAEPAPGGYAIELALAPPPRVTAVEIDGVRRDQLAALTILEGTLYDAPRLRRLAEAAAAWWRGRGYPHAEVTTQVESDCARGVIVHVIASLGRHYKLARLEIKGSAVAAPATMFERDFGEVNHVGGAYREDLFTEDLGTLITLHERAGWVEARVDKVEHREDDRTSTISASAQIVAGARARLGPLVVEGGTAAQRAVVVQRYSPLVDHWYDGEALRLAGIAVELALADLGATDYYESTLKNGRVALTVKIEARQ